MAINNVNVGNAPNDGLGNFLRDAFIIINSNFSYIDSTKVDKIAGWSLTQNNYTNSDKEIVTNVTSNLALKENVSNKVNNTLYDGTGTKYPTTDAVNLLINNFAIATTSTGLIDNNDTFLLSRTNDTTLHINGTSKGFLFKSKLLTPPYVPHTAIINIVTQDIPLSIFGLTTDGIYVKYLGLNDLGFYVISDSSYIQSHSVAQLGVLQLKVVSGVCSFLDNGGGRGVINLPAIAGYSDLENTMFGIQSSVLITPKTGTLFISSSAGSVQGQSVNWGGFNTNERLVSSVGTASFTQLHPGLLGTTTPPAFGITMSCDKYWNGSALVSLTANGNASIKRVMITITGTIAVQYGETQYTNLLDARDSISIAQFTNLLPEGTYTEICRIAAVKNATDLNNNTQAIFQTVGGGGGGGTTNVTVWGTIQGNINDQIDLKNALDAKFGGTSSTNYVPKFSGAGSIIPSNMSDDGTIISTATDMNINGVNVGQGKNNISTNTSVGGLNNITTGTNNVGVGYLNLNSATNSSYNTSVGASTATSLTGGDNTLFGYNVIGNATNANGIVAIGKQAGLSSVAGNNLTPLNSIYIGNATRPSADNQQNQIVIGYATDGNGSNTVTIGNNSITNTYLKGVVSANSFLKTGASASQYLMGDGSVNQFDSNIVVSLTGGKSLGKYTTGQTIPCVGKTFDQVLRDIAIEFLTPTFTSFSISGQATTVESGTVISGSKTFTWAFQYPQNVLANTMDVYYGITKLTGSPISTTSPQSVNVGTLTLTGNGTTYNFSGRALDTNSNVITSSNFGVVSRYRQFFGNVTSYPTDSASVRALASNNFANTNSFVATVTSTSFSISIPATKSLTSVITANNENITSSFALSTFNVNDAGGTPISYKTYNFTSALPLNLQITITVA